MLAYGYWQRKFGGDPNVIGRQLVIDGAPQRNHRRAARRTSASSTPIRMVVLPFRLNRAELFVGNFSFRGIARLKPGVTIAQANADVARMIPLVSDRFPMAPGFTKQMFQEAHIGPNVRPLAQDVIGDVGRVLWVLLGTVGIVLLIACANVANLFLVRAEGRQQELAIHAALGAGSGRIAWELLSESLLLGVHRRSRGTGARRIGIRSLVAHGARRAAARAGHRHRPRRPALHPRDFASGRGLCSARFPAIKFATPRLASALNQGGRLGHRQPAASPRPQRAGRGRDRAGRRAARRAPV